MVGGHLISVWKLPRKESPSTSEMIHSTVEPSSPEGSPSWGFVRTSFLWSCRKLACSISLLTSLQSSGKGCPVTLPSSPVFSSPLRPTKDRTHAGSMKGTVLVPSSLLPGCRMMGTGVRRTQRAPQLEKAPPRFQPSRQAANSELKGTAR